MKVRFSMCRGMPILEEGTQDFCGWISGIVINPDTGRVEGWHVRMGGGTAGEGFLMRDDVVRWGKDVWIRSVHAIGSIDDIVRLRNVIRDRRRILGQTIRTESGKSLGTCADIQFSTRTWELEWMFPRRFLFFWGVAIPRSSMIEVTEKAIVVRDRVLPQKESAKETVRLEELVEVPRPL